MYIFIKLIFKEMLLKSKKTIFFILIFILVFFIIFNNLNKINHIIFSYPDNIEFA